MVPTSRQERPRIALADTKGSGEGGPYKRNRKPDQNWDQTLPYLVKAFSSFLSFSLLLNQFLNEVEMEKGNSISQSNIHLCSNKLQRKSRYSSHTGRLYLLMINSSLWSSLIPGRTLSQYHHRDAQSAHHGRMSFCLEVSHTIMSCIFPHFSSSTKAGVSVILGENSIPDPEL